MVLMNVHTSLHSGRISRIGSFQVVSPRVHSHLPNITDYYHRPYLPPRLIVKPYCWKHHIFKSMDMERRSWHQPENFMYACWLSSLNHWVIFSALPSIILMWLLTWEVFLQVADNKVFVPHWKYLCFHKNGHVIHI